MESDLVNGPFDNRYALTSSQGISLIRALFNKNIKGYTLTGEKVLGAFWQISYSNEVNEISFSSDRGYLEYHLKINDEGIALNKYDERLNKVKVSSEKNISFVFETIRLYLLQKT